MENLNLAGKVAIVTGGARGIGFGAAQALSRRGAAAMIVDLDQDSAQGAAAQLGGGALGFGADVTDRDALHRVVATVVQERGGVDVVVANAGIASRGATLRAINDEVFDRVLAVNLGGVYNTVSAGLEQIAQRGGHIVVTSSVYAFLNGAGLAPYAIAKAGVEQLGRALRAELAPHAASAGVAYFGFIDTEMVRRTIDADPISERTKQATPRFLRKRLSPAEAGEALVRGIEQRAPRIIAPKRWTALSVLRGIVNPLLDDRMVKDAAAQEVIAELDARGGQEQPLTA